ncbi:MAG: IclR family transcriptional regulator [Steroidobacter sp.]
MDTTLIKGMRLFERLIHADAPLGVSALAVELDLQKSNVHRTLATLVELGYAEQDPAGRYRPTRRIWEQGMKVIRRDPIRRASISFMHALNAETQETISLAVLDGSDCLYLHQITTGTTIRPLATVGQRVPAVFPATGKTLLAYLPDVDKRVRAICAKRTNFGARKVSVPTLLEELAAIRKTGYAYSMNAWREGVHSVAGVVLGPGQEPFAAIGISGPAERLPKDRLKALSNSVLNACTQIGHALGAS